MSPITVVVADSRKASRTACVRLLESEEDIRVVGEARSGLDVLAAAMLRPRIVLLSLDLAPGHSAALVRVLRRRSRRTKVILLGSRAPEAALLETLSHGARGYIERSARRVFLLKAVRKVDAGEAWVSRRLAGQIVDRVARLMAGPRCG